MKRKTYTLSDEQFAQLLNAAKPVPYMIIGGVAPRSPQENANDVWKELGRTMGFIWNTAQPVSGGDQKAFTAVPLTEAAQ